MAGAMKLSFILEAVDRATAPVRRVQAVIDRVNEPIKRVRGSLNALNQASGLPKLTAAIGVVGKSFGNVIGEVGSLATKVGLIGIAGVAAFYPIKRTIDQFGTLNDHAQTLGISAEKLQELSYALSLDGGSIEDAAQSLKFLQRNAVQALAGSEELQKHFAKLGIGRAFVKKNLGDPEALLFGIADGMAKVKTPAEQLELTLALMGKGGSRVAQTLGRGSAEIKRLGQEARGLGLILDNDTVAKMDDAGDEMLKVERVLHSLTATIATAALPLIRDLSARIIKWAVSNRELVATKATKFFEEFGKALPDIVKSLGQIGRGLVWLISHKDGIAQLFGGWTNVIILLSLAMTGKLLFSIGMLVMSINKLGFVIMGTPVGWLLLAVAAIATSAFLIYQNWGPIKGFFIGLWDGVMIAFGDAFEWIDNKLTALGEKITTFVARAREKLPGILLGMGPLGAGLAVAGAAFGVIGPNATKAPSALPGGGRQDVGGTIKIQIEGAPAKVTELKSNNPNVDIDVYSGPTMAMIY